MKQVIFVEKSILIQADIKTIWDIMINWQNYSQWNPFIINVTEIPRKNKAMQMIFDLSWHNGKGGKSKEEMVSLLEPQNGFAELKYKYASVIAKLGFLQAERIQQLKTTENGTEYYTIEEYKGPLKGFVPLKSVKKGFQLHLEALKKISEYSQTY